MLGSYSNLLKKINQEGSTNSKSKFNEVKPMGASCSLFYSEAHDERKHACRTGLGK